MITITEALAELKTLKKRIEKKTEYVQSNILRQGCVKDPLESAGGQVEVIQKELQAIADLEARFVAIRIAIARANLENDLEIAGEKRSISAWLAWRREIAAGQLTRLNQVFNIIDRGAVEAKKRGSRTVPLGEEGEAQRDDLVINVDIPEMRAESERLVEVMGALDGKLSLFNATIKLEV